ncbi:hypothetical protein [Ruegeria sp. Alg231-54]|uniref:hypothetical protein n=1 Tax=Ruegeria sp. Alg231-54 TaxID=1922221 RepID=UPI000D553AE2|nr:hypothetical protein [Ruegeria sp. Alg231-54]
MRGITITYSFDGNEADWEATIRTFIEAINADPEAAGKFTYQVAVADDGKSRVHWGRWDSAETLAHVQSQPYFQAFAPKVKQFAGKTLTTTGHDITLKSSGW